MRKDEIAIGLFMYSVFDSQVGAYSQPLFYQFRGEAVRQFMDAANDATTGICKYAAHYTLFELGAFDRLTGKFVSYDAPISLGCAIEFKDKPV